MTRELQELLGAMNEDEQYDFFIELEKRYPLVQQAEKGSVQSLSIGFADTPKSLYRFLYLWKPKDMDFSDMYKSHLAMVRIHPNAVVCLCLYKYELAAYLYTTPDAVRKREIKPIEISCGVPGYANESLVEGSEIHKEFQIFRGLLEMKHNVYSGNEFKC
jgi:hypothetical protein